MERFRRQKLQAEATRSSSPSKVTTVIDRTSDDKLSSNDRPRRGNPQIVKQKFQKSGSDSSAHARARCKTTLEDQLAFELGRSNSAPRACNLMKSLLTDEMSEEVESRRRSPSIIAKLMGLDRMPNQHGINKQSKRPSGHFNGKPVSSSNNQPCRKIEREQQLFKDIYEVRESLEGQTEGYSFQVPPNRRHKECKMASIRRKSMDAKRLSIDEKFQGSKEHDLLLAKHLRDLHASPQPRCGNVRNQKVPNVLDHHFTAIGCQAGRGASQKIDLSRDCQEGVHCHVSHRKARVSDKSVIFLSKGKEEATSATPTKIVLLKPDLGRSHKTAKSFSSSSSSHELWSDVEMCKKKQMDVRHGDAELWGNKRLPIDLAFSAHKSQESRVLAKEITQQMKRNLGKVSSDAPFSGYRGYSADESSHDMSSNDSCNESDRTFLASQIPYRSSFQGKSSSSRYAQSSMNKEGKKRLSERWKLTHRSAEVRMGKGATLGEMLSMLDMDNSSPNMDVETAENGSFGRFNHNVRLEGPVKPLGISSKDGWKDGYRSSSGSTSLASPCDHIKHPKSYIKHEVLGGERFLFLEDGAGHGRKKAIYRDLTWKEGSSSGNRRLRDKKHRSSHRMSEEMVIDDQEEHVGGSGKKGALEEKDSPELKTVILETPTFSLDAILNLDSMEIEPENISIPPSSHDDLLPAAELSNELRVKDRSNSSVVHESTQEQSRPLVNDGLSPCLQNPVAQPESPVSSKEADQPSPVSVLQAPFSEDLSPGSECFEGFITDIHGLRMQLELFKLESDAYGEGEGSLLISSDGDEGSARFAEAAKWSIVSEAAAWEASYTSDVLTGFGLQDTDPDLVMTTWNSTEYPVDPRVFEKLEKYSDQSADSSRPDRRLLFDRIKCGITDIAQRSVSPHPWVKTRQGTKTGPRLTNVGLKAELHKLLADQAMVEKGAEVVLQSDAQWMDLETYIDGIGREVGKMVLDELISESLTM